MIEIRNLTKIYKKQTVLNDVNLRLEMGKIYGLVGVNGSGKTTLMKIIDGRIKPDSGNINIGQTIKMGYYTQEIENDKDAGIAYMDSEDRVIDYIKNTAEFVRTEEGLVSASVMLERFLFPSSQQYSKIGKLSGGERRRLNLLRVLMEAPNVLILDEPTNDLDIETMTILEDYLDHFEGIIITVSHDRYFLDRICDGLFILQNQHIRYVNGGYSQNLDTSTKEEKEKGQGALAYKQSKQNKIKMTYMEKKEFEGIEDVIMGLETKLNEVEEKMNGVTDFKEIDELSKQRDEIQNQIDEKNERYLYLLELQEQIENQ